MGATGHGPAKAAKRSSYTRDIESKFRKLESTVSGIKEKAEHSIAAGRLERNEQLTSVEFQVESQLAAVRRQIEHLRDAKIDSWPHHKRELESCWDDMLHAIKNLVARIS